MNMAFLRASFIALILTATPAFSGTLQFKGGIGYWVYTGKSCPAPQLIKASTSHFLLRERPGAICFEPSPIMLYTFVLGSLEAANYTVSEPSSLGGTTDFSFTIPSPAEQLISTPAVNSSGRLTFHVNGFGKVFYVVQKTSDFQTWIDVITLIGESDFTETSASVGPVYYRVKVVEPPAASTI